MNKRVLSIILAVAMIFSLAATISVTASAETYFKYKELDNGTIEITGCYGSLETIEIPSTIDGKAVTSIGEDAFLRCESLRNVTIPNSIVSINSFAFSGCESLESINIPNSVTCIDNRAFADCISLKKVTIGTGVTSIGEKAFYNTSLYNNDTNWQNGVLYIGDYLISGKLEIYDSYAYNFYLIDEVKGNYRIKDGTKIIADNAFRNCTLLTGITMPDSLINIGYWAFSSTSLKSVVIGKNVTTINDWAFDSCESLTSIIIPDNVKNIGGAFYGTALYNNESNWKDGVLYIGNHLIAASEDLEGSYKIKDGTKTIASGAFSGCRSLTEIIIPDSINVINDDTFSNCSSLTSVTIPDSVTEIGDSAFFWCKALISITIPESVTSIGYDAFTWCESLTNITIPDSVIHIDDNAFCGDYNLVIDCYKGSTAEQFAINHGIRYIWHISVNIIDPSVDLGFIESIKKEEDTLLTLIVHNTVASEFTEWEINGEYEIIDGSLTSSTITIRPNSGRMEIKAILTPIEPPFTTFGDANGDNSINMLDVLYIRKYIAKQPVKPNLTASDVTDDGNVNMFDVLLIRKYIAKQPVHLGPQA